MDELMELAKLKKRQEDHENKTGWLGAIGNITDAIDNSTTTIGEQLYGMKKPRMGIGKALSSYAQAQESPLEKEARLLKIKELQSKIDDESSLSDPSSPESASARAAFQKLGLPVSDNMSAASLKTNFGKIHDYNLAKFKAEQERAQLNAERENKRNIEKDKGGGVILTEGQKALDKQFAKEYSDFIARGGYADVEKNLNQLNEVKNSLGKTDFATGPLIGVVPKGIRDVVAPEGAAMQDAVEEVVQRNLRLVLGAQFTEKEGKRLIDRAYNPRLSEKENTKRVGRLIDQIQKAAEAKMAAAKHFETHKTLDGFKGTQLTMDDMLNTLDGKGGGESASTVSDEDKQALNWAKANPNDPRAEKILMKLGYK